MEGYPGGRGWHFAGSVHFSFFPLKRRSNFSRRRSRLSVLILCPGFFFGLFQTRKYYGSIISIYFIYLFI